MPDLRGGLYSPCSLREVLLLAVVLLLLHGSWNAPGVAHGAAAGPPTSADQESRQKDEVKQMVVLHESLVGLLSTESSVWSVSVSGEDARWMTAEHVRIEALAAEHAATLTFTPPSLDLGTSHDKGKRDEQEQQQQQHLQLFGHPSLIFSGLSCEEYGGSQRSASSRLRGRCFLQMHSGQFYYFNYNVVRGRQRSSGATAEFSHGDGASSWTSEGIILREELLLDGATPTDRGNAEAELRRGQVEVVETVLKMEDREESTRYDIVFHLHLQPEEEQQQNLGEAPATLINIQLRLHGLTGGFADEATRRSVMQDKVQSTSFFARWIYPVLYIAALYLMLYGVAWMTEKRRRHASSMSAAASTEDVATKKQL